MMRRPQNYGYEPVPQSSSATDDMEVENEKLAEELKSKISSLKSLTIDIGRCIDYIHFLSLINVILLGNEVRYQDKILNDLDDDMSKSSGIMKNTIGKVLRLTKHKKGFTCYMLGFALLIFLILYIFIKFR